MLEEYGLRLIRLDLPFRLNHVNCFLAEGVDGYKVIDVGLHNKETVKRWEEELAGKEVTDLIITHYHPDHYGYAGAFQEKYGPQVSMSQIDAENGLYSWEEGLLSELGKYYTLSGIPEQVARQMIENTEEFVPRVQPYPTVGHYLVEGEKLVLGKYEYEVIFTPGHSEGLVTFYNKEKNALLSTDHILPKITPNISHWFHGDPNPLASYFDSLDKIAALEVDFVIPSHGKPFHDGHLRVLELKAHHDERLAALHEIIQTGCTVYEACEKLFNKQLNIHETRFAIGETLAHLEYLRLNGECIRELQGGVYVYRS
ncbi:MBL fold metallo-hydrolase [Oceanobacillus sp. AG]|uniref:MBL fold metallo-hydrolase n=1 Tax=Oceanobacillus sp. AG TaxID=2681969 RepID=UPI0012EB1248|nr:MBL fold metallo-hydrolase [Oceanobacillus sp. AG]